MDPPKYLFPNEEEQSGKTHSGEQQSCNSLQLILDHPQANSSAGQYPPSGQGQYPPQVQYPPEAEETIVTLKNQQNRETKPNIEQTRTTPQLNPLNYSYKNTFYYV